MLSGVRVIGLSSIENRKRGPTLPVYAEALAVIRSSISDKAGRTNPHSTR